MEAPDLVEPGHRYVERAISLGKVPGRAQGHLRRLAEGAPTPSLLSGAGDGLHASRSQVNRANGVIPGVGHVEGLAGERQSKGMVEGSRLEAGVVEARLATADHGVNSSDVALRLQADDEDAVVVSVWDRTPRT